MSYYTENDLRMLGIRDFGERVRLSRKASVYNPSEIIMGCDSRIDDFCILSAGNGGIKIKSHVHIAAFCLLIGEGKITLEDFSGLSSRVSIYSSTDDYSGIGMTNPTVPKKYRALSNADIILGKHVIIGSGSVILPGAVIEDGVAVGALSLVKGKCFRFGIYAGNPARRIAERNDDLLLLESELLNKDYNDI